MKHTRMDERILVCASYGPNGERLIRRGCKIARMLDCPLYILVIDPRPKDELDIEKAHDIANWQRLAEEHGAEEFLVLYEEKRPVPVVIGEIARRKQITQIILGQTAKSRWKEITEGSIINALLREVPFVDLHIVAVDRALKSQGQFEKGVHACIVPEEGRYRLTFDHAHDKGIAGIFFKEIGTDFNNGIFKFMSGNRAFEVHVVEDIVVDDVPEDPPH